MTMGLSPCLRFEQTLFRSAADLRTDGNLPEPTTPGPAIPPCLPTGAGRYLALPATASPDISIVSQHLVASSPARYHTQIGT